MDRKELLRKRKNINNREEKEKAIAQAVLPFLKGNVAMYNPIGSEVNILRFVDYKNSYFPVCLENYQMEFYKYSENQIQGAFQVMEPERICAIDPDALDVMIIPMVGFYHCQRVGYGKGYYDRYLERYAGLKIGIAFDEQALEPFLKKETDIDMDLVITPTQIIRNDENK
ncbi:MAG: 5-formyltetrahydrofolate cyclo-ligase [Bacillota bacterium]|nr:5-formyltetrahydrofolate cyclo-ligase [Bacillota bacterium]